MSKNIREFVQNEVVRSIHKENERLTNEKEHLTNENERLTIINKGYKEQIIYLRPFEKRVFNIEEVFHDAHDKVLELTKENIRLLNIINALDIC